MGKSPTRIKRRDEDDEDRDEDQDDGEESAPPTRKGNTRVVKKGNTRVDAGERYKQRQKGTIGDYIKKLVLLAFLGVIIGLGIVFYPAIMKMLNPPAVVKAPPPKVEEPKVVIPPPEPPKQVEVKVTRLVEPPPPPPDIKKAPDRDVSRHSKWKKWQRRRMPPKVARCSVGSSFPRS